MMFMLARGEPLPRITHHNAQVAALRWAMSQSWCGTAAMEVEYAEGRMDVLAVTKLEQAEIWPGHDAWYSFIDKINQRASRLATREYQAKLDEQREAGPIRPASRATRHKRSMLEWRGQVSAVKASQDARTIWRIGNDHKPDMRVLGIEVKVTVDDLRRDKKLLFYDPYLSHAALCGTREVLDYAKTNGLVPSTWGLIEVSYQEIRRGPSMVYELAARSERPCKRLRPTPPVMLQRAMDKVARSAAFRAMVMLEASDKK